MMQIQRKFYLQQLIDGKQNGLIKDIISSRPWCCLMKISENKRWLNENGILTIGLFDFLMEPKFLET